MRPISASTQGSLAQTTTRISTPKKTEKRNGAASYAGKRTYLFPQNDLFSFFSFVQPEQFFAEPRYTLRRTGEYRLLIAVLQDALECWFRYRGAQRIREQRLFREIEEWFSSHNHDRLFAFECICDYLALDPDFIRHGLMQWRSSHAQRSAPRFYLTPVVNSHTHLKYTKLRKNKRVAEFAGRRTKRETEPETQSSKK